MSGHTRAPWSWDGDDLWHFGNDYNDAEDPHRYTGISKDRRLNASPIQEANARLIAAAPEMLDALMQIQRMGYTDIGDRVMVEAVIAKATGAQS